MSYRDRHIIKSIQKRFQTCLIGALARFENGFSHLWDQEDPEGDKYFEVWQKVRNEILNHGNFQSRAAIEDLEEYLYNNVNKYPFNYKFYNKENGNGEQRRLHD